MFKFFSKIANSKYFNKIWILVFVVYFVGILIKSFSNNDPYEKMVILYESFWSDQPKLERVTYNSIDSITSFNKLFASKDTFDLMNRECEANNKLIQADLSKEEHALGIAKSLVCYKFIGASLGQDYFTLSGISGLNYIKQRVVEAISATGNTSYAKRINDINLPYSLNELRNPSNLAKLSQGDIARYMALFNAAQKYLNFRSRYSFIEGDQNLMLKVLVNEMYTLIYYYTEVSAYYKGNT